MSLTLCNQCGKKPREGARYCTRCGFRLATLAPRPAVGLPRWQTAVLACVVCGSLGIIWLMKLGGSPRQIDPPRTVEAKRLERPAARTVPAPPASAPVSTFSYAPPGESVAITPPATAPATETAKAPATPAWIDPAKKPAVALSNATDAREAEDVFKEMLTRYPGALGQHTRAKLVKYHNAIDLRRSSAEPKVVTDSYSTKAMVARGGSIALFGPYDEWEAGNYLIVYRNPGGEQNRGRIGLLPRRLQQQGYGQWRAAECGGV